MNRYTTNDMGSQLAEFETPFTDIPVAREEPYQREAPTSYSSSLLSELESPFIQTYDTTAATTGMSPAAGEFVQFLGELNDSEFSDTLYELAAELEDTWTSKVSNEIAMGDRFVPYTTQMANEYFAPLITATETMIDRAAQQFSGNNLADHSETSVERFFSETPWDQSRLSPAQEQFFGSIFNKVKNVVKKGVELAKKGISFVGKFLPINIVLNKLKGLIRPLLDKVLKFAIGKLPKNLQPYAQSLAKKFLNLETSYEASSDSNEIPTTGELEAVQAEFDGHIANLVFSGEEYEADNLVLEYESSSDSIERSNRYETGNIPSLDAAREQFIQELKSLQPGESAAPAIERFLPAALLALQPVIKIALSIIGRQRVINFLAGLLAKLVGRYVPENVAQPLAASIIDVGLSAIGFETFEMNKADVAYEAIANTVEETIQNIGELNEATLNDQEALTAQLLEAFEVAAANNFPSQYIKEELRTAAQHAAWVMKPRNGPKHLYKKYSRVFTVTIDPQTAANIMTFRGVPLSKFLQDKLGLDPSKPVQARVHLYQTLGSTKLSQISRHENVPGLGQSQPYAWVQLHPLSKQAASLLLKEPRLGKDFSPTYTTRRTHVAVGQRFYYLEISGARLKIHRKQRDQRGAPEVSTGRPAQSADIQAVINFVKSEIRLNYYLSEEDAKSLVEKLSQNDFVGASMNIRHSIKTLLNGILRSNISNKVKIIHEAMPEMYLENYNDQQEQFAPLSMIKSAVSGISLNAGKTLLNKLIEMLVDKLSGLAHESVLSYFKSKAAEFKQAQAQPEDGVTIKIVWANIAGMSGIKAVINAIRGNLSINSISGLSLPSIPTPEVKIAAGKNFD